MLNNWFADRQRNSKSRPSLKSNPTFTLQKKHANTCIAPTSVTSILIILRWPGLTCNFSRNSLKRKRMPISARQSAKEKELQQSKVSIKYLPNQLKELQQASHLQNSKRFDGPKETQVWRYLRKTEVEVSFDHLSVVDLKRIRKKLRHQAYARTKSPASYRLPLQGKTVQTRQVKTIDIQLKNNID